MNSLYAIIRPTAEEDIPRPLRNLETLVVRPAMTRDAPALTTLRADHITSSAPLSLARLFTSSLLPGTLLAGALALAYQVCLKYHPDTFAFSLAMYGVAAVSTILLLGLTLTNAHFDRVLKAEKARRPLEPSTGGMSVALVSNRYVGFGYIIPQEGKPVRSGELRVFVHANHRTDAILPRLVEAILRSHPQIAQVSVEESAFQDDILARWTDLSLEEVSRVPAGPWGSVARFEGDVRGIRLALREHA